MSRQDLGGNRGGIGSAEGLPVDRGCRVDGSSFEWSQRFAPHTKVVDIARTAFAVMPGWVLADRRRIGRGGIQGAAGRRNRGAARFPSLGDSTIKIRYRID